MRFERFLVDFCDNWLSLRDMDFTVPDGRLYPEFDRYLEMIGNKMIPQEAVDKIPFKFHIVRDPTINAFAIPNGEIFLHTGLLARLKNEAQLAFVLGHEIGHILRNHVLKFSDAD